MAVVSPPPPPPRSNGMVRSATLHIALPTLASTSTPPLPPPVQTLPTVEENGVLPVSEKTTAAREKVASGGRGGEGFAPATLPPPTAPTPDNGCAIVGEEPAERRGSTSTTSSSQTLASTSSDMSFAGQDGKWHQMYPRPAKTGRGRRDSEVSAASHGEEACGSTGPKVSRWKALFSPSSTASSRSSTPLPPPSSTNGRPPSRLFGPRNSLASAAMAKSASADTPSASPARTPRASVYGGVGLTTAQDPQVLPTQGMGRRASEPLSPSLLQQQQATLPSAYSSSALPTSSTNPSARWKNPFSARPSTSSGLPNGTTSRPFGAPPPKSTSLHLLTEWTTPPISSSPSSSPTTTKKTRLRTRPSTSSGIPSSSFPTPARPTLGPPVGSSSELDDSFHLARAPLPAPIPAVTNGTSSSSAATGSPAKTLFAKKGRPSTSTGTPERAPTLSTSTSSSAMPLSSSLTHERSSSTVSEASSALEFLSSPTTNTKKKPSLSDSAFKAGKTLLSRRQHQRQPSHQRASSLGTDTGEDGVEELAPPSEEEILSWKRPGSRTGRSVGSSREMEGFLFGSSRGGRGGRERGWSAGSSSRRSGSDGAEGGPRRGSDSSEEVLVISSAGSRPGSGGAGAGGSAGGASAGREDGKKEADEAAFSVPPRTSALPLFPPASIASTSANTFTSTTSTTGPSPFPAAHFPSSSQKEGRRRSSASPRPNTAPALPGSLPNSGSSPFAPVMSKSTSITSNGLSAHSADTSCADGPGDDRNDPTSHLNVLDFIALDSGRADALPFRFPQSSPPKAGAFFPAPAVGAAALERQKSAGATSDGSAATNRISCVSLGSDEGMVLEGLDNPSVVGRTPVASSAGSSPVLLSVHKLEGEEKKATLPDAAGGRGEDEPTPRGNAIPAANGSRLPTSMQKLFASPAARLAAARPKTAAGTALARPSSRAANPPAALSTGIEVSTPKKQLQTSAIPLFPASRPRPAAPTHSMSSTSPSTSPARVRALSPSPVPPPRPPRAPTRPSPSTSPTTTPSKQPLVSNTAAWAPVPPASPPSLALGTSIARPVRSHERIGLGGTGRMQETLIIRAARRGSVEGAAGAGAGAPSRRSSVRRKAEGNKEEQGRRERRSFTPPPSPPESDETRARRTGEAQA
ncbi:hypothetical protein JCM11251_005231 [Rhodosporidiobolus azoricus]